MAIEEVRIYELADEQTTLTDTDLGVLDKSGYIRAKKFTMLNFYNYVKNKLTGSFTGKAFHKLYVKSDETGLEFKGSPGDYTPIENDELDGLTVEIAKSVDGEIVANAMTSVAGLTANTIRNTDLGTPTPTSKLVYYDVSGEVLRTVEVQNITLSYSELNFIDLSFSGGAIQILPSAGVGKYYSDVLVIFENTPDSIFTNPNGVTSFTLSTLGSIPFSLSLLNTDNVFFLRGVQTTTDSAIMLDTNNSQQLIGFSNCNVRIYYKVNSKL